MRRNEPSGRLLALTLLILGLPWLAQVLGGLAGWWLLGPFVLGVVGGSLPADFGGPHRPAGQTAPNGNPCGGSPPLTPPWSWCA